MDVWKQFEENGITHSGAHHLLAVFSLKKERGYARVTDVAKHLNITTGSASTNLKGLKQKGFITEDDNKFLILSKQGEMLARAVIARKEIFKKFLIDVIQVSEEQAELDSCKTEHLISHETSEKLLAFMQSLNKNSNKQKLNSISCNISSASCPGIKDGDSSGTNCSVCEDHCLMQEC
jgi:DtxR family Mn-dependent transcriptional regulator